MINNEIFQKILDRIIGFFPAEWQRVVFYMEYGEASYSAAFYVKEGGSYVNCFELPNVTEDELYTAFDEIDEFVSEERNNSKEDNWTNMTMCVDCTGKMLTDFDYSDLTENSYEYEKRWKKKYLQ